MDISDLLPYVCALLALLLIWQYHQNQVLTGRIQAVDIFDRSGTRMYVFATPDDEEICDACREVNGMTFLPSSVARKDFHPRRGSCSNRERCVIVMMGMYGAWPEAKEVVKRLRAAGKQDGLRLSTEELVGLTEGSWQSSVSAATDRLSVTMLAALTGENLHPVAAQTGYRQVINDAQEVRDLTLVVPAYLRLTQLLARDGRADDALEVIDDFERRYPKDKTGPHYPKGVHRGMMTIMKSRLKTAVPRPGSMGPTEHTPATETLPTNSVA